MDLDLRVLGVSLLFSSSLIPHKHLLILLEFESEGFEHLCSSYLHWLHQFALSMRIRGSDSLGTFYS